MNSGPEQSRVESLLADRGSIPWATLSPGARERTLAAIAAADRVDRSSVVAILDPRVRLAAAACIVLGLGAMAVLQLSGRFGAGQAPPRSVALDPAPLVAPAILTLSTSADESLQSEARGLLDDADRVTRRVVAQLPFTGSRF